MSHLAASASFLARPLARPDRDARVRSAIVRSVVVAFVVALALDSSAQEPAGWRMDGTGDFPLAVPPIEWSPKHHVVWSTPMPSWSNSSPIVVGERLFVSSEPDTLICLDAADGRILWEKANPVEDTIPTATGPTHSPRKATSQSELQSSLQAKEYELTALRQLLLESPSDPAANQGARVLKEEIDRLRHQIPSLAASTPTHPSDANGYSTPTPTSGGDSVYALFGTGVVAAYDLDGRRRWIRFVDQARDSNGSSASPVLVGDKILILINDLIALDRATGEVQWRVNVPPRPGTPIAFKVEDRDFVITPSGHCVRVADGAIVASGIGDLDYASPVIRDRVLYMIQQTARAFRLPEKVGDPLEFQPLWTTRMKGERYYSSPLVLEDLIYAVTRGQILSVLDAKTGEQVYVQRLRLGWTGAADSVYTSPTRGGRYVYVSGLSGRTAVLKPGRRFEQLASNDLETFRSSPVFRGDRMYVRGQEKFYCLSDSAEHALGPKAVQP